MKEVDFFSDDFGDIVAKDKRYDARAYAFLSEVVHWLSKAYKRHVSGEEILDEFKEFALDQYGPLTYTVLTEWRVRCTEDIGEMIFNLVDSHRVLREEHDTREVFVGGYDFREAFLAPFQT